MAHTRPPDAERPSRDELVYGKLNQLGAILLASVAIVTLLLAVVGIFLNGRNKALAARVAALEPLAERVAELEREVGALRHQIADAAEPRTADPPAPPPPNADNGRTTPDPTASAPPQDRLRGKMSTPAARRDARWKRDVAGLLDELGGAGSAAAGMSNDELRNAMTAAVALERFDDASRWLQALIDRGAAATEDARAVARLGHRTGRFQPALQAMLWASAQAPPTAEALLLTAELQHRAGDTAGRDGTLASMLQHADAAAALAGADASFALVSAGVVARLSLQLALDAGRLDEALAMRGQISAEDAESEAVLRRLGRRLLEARRPRDALALFGELARRNPGAAANLDGVGVALLDLMLHDEALATLEQAVALEDADADVWFHLGAAKAAKANLDGALAAFQQATEMDARHARAHFGVAVTYARMGRQKECESALEQALALDPSLAAVAGRIPALQRALVGEAAAAPAAGASGDSGRTSPNP